MTFVWLSMIRIRVFAEAVRRFVLTLVSQRIHKEAMMISKRHLYVFLIALLISIESETAALAAYADT
jgi:hypothetical protein